MTLTSSYDAAHYTQMCALALISEWQILLTITSSYAMKTGRDTFPARYFSIYGIPLFINSSRHEPQRSSVDDRIQGRHQEP